MRESKYAKKKSRHPVIDDILGLLGVMSVPVAIIVACYFSLSLNAQQESYLSSHHISKEDFLTSWCEKKLVCKEYAQIKPSCTGTNNVQNCLKTGMKEKDFSACAEDGNIVGMDAKVLPNFAQCTGNKILSANK